MDFSTPGHVEFWSSDSCSSECGSWRAATSALQVPDSPVDFFYCLCHPHLAITSDVQLHNRADLLRALGPGLRDAADNHLIVAAYSKWGEECPAHLLGEFAFAIWDERQKRLFCCRDHLGHRAFLYWRNSTHFVFANDIAHLLQHPKVPRELNRRKLSGLAVPTGEHVHHEETFHAGIFSLPPGSTMTVNSGVIRKSQYWELQLDSLPVPPSRPEDAYEALREILFEAVACRIDKDFPAAAFLSGGLDSSAIVSIAASCLEKQNRQLTAVAAVLPEDRRTQFSDEREYVDEFRSWPNVSIKYVTAPGRGPLDQLDSPNRYIGLPARSSRCFLIEECEKAAIDSGSRCLMYGGAGELGVTSWNSRYYLDLAVRLRWLALAREMKGRRTHRNVSSLRRLAGLILGTLFPQRGWGVAVLFARDFQREYRPRPAWRSRSPFQRQFQAAHIRLWIRTHAIDRGQAVTLLPWSRPLADKRVLEFCLALPPSMNVHDGYPRYLVRRALDGLLPPRIQWRTDKTPFSPDYNIRFNAQLDLARQFVSAIGPHDPVRSVIDVARIERLLVPVIDTKKENEAARDWVPCSLYAINFLRQFSEFRP